MLAHSYVAYFRPMGENFTARVLWSVNENQDVSKKADLKAK